jgi:tetratricopeptide (TPR) repeat protein
MTARKSGIEESETGDEKEARPDEKIQEGIQLFRMKDWGRALNAFLSKDTVGFNSDEKIELAYYLGLCYTKLDQYEEALIYLEQVVTSASDILRVFQCRMTLAYIYVKTKRIKMAEYELKRLKNSGLESTMNNNTQENAA